MTLRVGERDVERFKLYKFLRRVNLIDYVLLINTGNYGYKI